VEAWACSSDTDVVGDEGGEKSRLCNEVRAARWLLVPVLVAGSGMLALVGWEQLSRRKADTRIAVVGVEEGKVQGSV